MKLGKFRKVKKHRTVRNLLNGISDIPLMGWVGLGWLELGLGIGVGAGIGEEEVEVFLGWVGG